MDHGRENDETAAESDVRLRATIAKAVDGFAGASTNVDQKSSLVLPTATEPMVDCCPVKGVAVAAASCQDCTRLLRVRRLGDGGGSVTMHVCDTRL